MSRATWLGLGLALVASACGKPEPIQSLSVATLTATPPWDWNASREVSALGDTRVYFGSAQVSQWDFWPVILIVREGEPPRLVDTKAAGLDNHAWVYAGVSEDEQHWWAIADFAVEGPGHTLELIASHDGGETWDYWVSIPKPNYWALFESFEMDASGHGRLTVRFESGTDPGFVQAAKHALRPQRTQAESGRYTYRTRDWGRSWKGPSHRTAVDYDGYEPYDLPSLDELLASPTATP